MPVSPETNPLVAVTLCLLLATALSACSDSTSRADADDPTPDLAHDGGLQTDLDVADLEGDGAEDPEPDLAADTLGEPPMDVIDTHDEPADDVGEPDLVVVDLSDDAAGADIRADGDVDPDAGVALGTCRFETFNNLGTYDAETLPFDDFTVTGSDTLHVSNAGITVVDLWVDAGEWVRFSLAAPTVGLVYELGGSTGPSGRVGETVIHAFDGEANGLGQDTVTNMGPHFVSEAFEQAPIGAFELRPTESSGIRVSALALECCRVTEDFTARGTATAASLTLDDVTLEASADLQLTTGVGLGVVGATDAQIDADEWVRFTFAQPVMRASFYVSAASAEYVDVDLEVFDAAGTSLGESGTFVQDDDTVRIRASNYEKISGFRIQGVADGHTIGNLEFWVDCPLP